MSERPDVASFQDLYIDRPLPYLIGSQQFMEQDDVGLGDLSSEGMCWHDLLFLCKQLVPNPRFLTVLNHRFGYPVYCSCMVRCRL